METRVLSLKKPRPAAPPVRLDVLNREKGMLSAKLTARLGLQPGACLTCQTLTSSASALPGGKCDPDMATRGHLIPLRFHKVVMYRYWIQQCQACNADQGGVPFWEWMQACVSRGDHRAPVMLATLVGLFEEGLSVQDVAAPRYSTRIPLRESRTMPMCSAGPS